MHTDWSVRRVDFVPLPFRSSFQTALDMMRRMVVDPSVALPSVLKNLSGNEAADTIVDYDLAKAGLAAVGGPQAFDLHDLSDETRTEEYEVLLKKS